MKQTSQRNDAPAARPADSAAPAADPFAAELKPNALGAPRLQLLPGVAGAPRFAAGFVDADAFGPAGCDPAPRATFGEDEFAEEEEDEFGDEEEEEDEFDDDEDEDDEFDDEEDEDDEFDDDEEEDDEEDEELIADEEEEVENED